MKAEKKVVEMASMMVAKRVDLKVDLMVVLSEDSKADSLAE
jgi:hypothetical protein